MDLNSLLGPLAAQLLTLPMLFFPLFVGIVTEAIKRVVQQIWPSSKGNFWFSEVFLFVLPLILGGGLGALLFGLYPFAAFISTRATAVIVCTVLGGISGLVYHLAIKILRKKAKAVAEKILKNDDSKP